MIALFSDSIRSRESAASLEPPPNHPLTQTPQETTSHSPNLFASVRGHGLGLMANVLEFIEGGESSGSQAATEELMKYEKKKPKCF